MRNKKEEISIVEGIQCDAEVRAMIILVLLALKPATHFTLGAQEEEPASVCRKMRQIGLCAFPFRRLPDTRTDRTAELTVSRSSYLAKRLGQEVRACKRHLREMGKHLGYPATSLEALAGIRKAPEDPSRPFVHGVIVDRGLTGFPLSADSCQKEQQVRERWWEAIRLHAPGLAEEIAGRLSG